MKTRILIAAIFVPLIFVTLFFLPPYAVTILVTIITVVASFELVRAVGASTVRRLYVYAGIAAAIIPVAVLFGTGSIFFRVLLYAVIVVLFADAVITSTSVHRIALSHIAAVLFGGVVIPYFLSAIISLKLFENGRFYVLVPFLVAFITDGGAYFTGVFFGKHKAFPSVSPKKTVEGCIGGILTGVAALVVFGAIVGLSQGIAVRFWALILYGLGGGVVTELGDLAFSLIKREFGVKDYSNLIPGHGGMLDRFDSMIFAAPAVFMLAKLFPAF
ncbi:phosphatidate cytidylyltransferase [Oscillospiraceae bacterium CM]|nr:phosphatidate cytidylyltransferase [Oscillospiraceae bacterium CM]